MHSPTLSPADRSQMIPEPMSIVILALFLWLEDIGYSVSSLIWSVCDDSFFFFLYIGLLGMTQLTRNSN